ncbi:nucleotide exchange factor GrpE [Gynuella sunshinyii]|uniref:Protein GrpE n=1 Tax=Gynuella sunshinyii YC6258 TaxID=1445510 RepID=A0A0C5VVU6_9GAMM|nr:nucleotide exchange factor GrpE [Gynuella sunshinyii]AJQ97438.1 molecular chaperone GrpE (heat shock protein) [Gynuella sunshinyii YC6258]
MTTENQTVDQGTGEGQSEELLQQETQPEQQGVADEAVTGTEGGSEAAEEIAALKEQLLRVHADMQNLRRRMEKDVEAAHKFGQEKLIKELLPVMDNLERALEAAPQEERDSNPVLEGVNMTLGLFTSALNKSDVHAINPEGEPFDPQLHQAMSMVDNPEVEPNTVIAVMQKGYTLAGRLVRPAMVMVSKGGGQKTIDEQA